MGIFNDTVMSNPDNKTDLLIIKYYVKSLLKYDEYQLGVEARIGYDHLLKAEKLNNEILVGQHSHTKETIKITLNRM